LYKVGISCGNIFNPFWRKQRTPVKTRIRHYRKQRGLTQTALALRLGTTAATVSRLETADMTISTDWLARIADALDVPAIDLIDAPATGPAALSAELRRGGRVAPSPAVELPLSGIAARQPVTLKVMEDLGPYCAGDMLVAERMAAAEAASVLGCDCIAADADGHLGFGRLVAVEGDVCLLAPPEPGQAAMRVAADWIAPVFMLVRRYATPVRPRAPM
jgi:transcriptional regulator with XRE-family HTH domain